MIAKTFKDKIFLMILVGVLFLIGAIFFVLANPSINFVDPTLSDGNSTENDWIYVNITSSDIGDHYTFVDFNSDLIAWYTFDNTSGSVLNDSGSYGNNGTMQNIIINSSGYWGNAGSFNGSSYANISTIVGDLSSTTTGTFSIWVRPSDSTPTSSNYFFSFGDSSASEDLSLQITSAGILKIFSRDSGSIQWTLETDSSPFVSDEWTHVVLVQNGTYPIIYINGSEVAQTFSGSADLTSWFFELTGIDNARIGDRNLANLSEIGFFTGLIDEVGIWKRALSSVEVSSLYNASANQYFHNFTNLSYGSYSFIGYSVNKTGSKNETGLITITVTQDFSPSYSSGGVNNTIYNLSTNFSLIVNDDVALHNNGYYIFSTNNTGVWVNDSVANFTSTPQTISSIKILNSTAGACVGYRWYLYDNAGNENITEIFTLITTPETISILYPLQHLVFQRDNSTTGQIKIVGNYSGNPTAIEAKFNNSDWLAINSSPSGGIFTGYLNVSTGNGTLSVRFSNDPSVDYNVSDIGVGDVFVIAGQSNAVAQGSNLNTLNSSCFATQFNQSNDVWIIANDPVNDVRKGTPYPIIANYICDSENIPIAFIPTARGGTVITEWQKGQTQYDNMYDKIVSATNGTMKVKTLLFLQGESDIESGVEGNYADYKANLNNTLNDFLDDTTIAETVILSQISRYQENRTNTDNIRKAQQDLWNGINISEGAILYDILINDNLHFKNDAEIGELARRWWLSIEDSIYEGEDNSAPYLVSSNLINNETNSKIQLNFNKNVKIEYWNGTVSSKAEGWRINDSNTIYNDSNVTLTEVSGSIVNLTLSSLVSNGSLLWMGSSLDSYGKAIIRDNVTSLPSKLFFSETLEIHDITPPAITISSPTSGQSVTESSLSLSVTTNENSTCNYSTDSGTTNSSLTANSAGTGHTGALSSLSDGDYTLNVYCADILGNANNTMSVSFSVSISSSSSDTLNSGGSTTYTPRDEQIDEGYVIKLKKNNKVKLDIKSQEVIVQVKEVSNEEVIITIEGKSYIIEKDSSEKIDLDSDGVYDLEILNYGTTLTSLGKKAKMEFKEIFEEIGPEQQEEVNENVEVENEEGIEISFLKKIGNFFEKIWNWIRFWK